MADDEEMRMLRREHAIEQKILEAERKREEEQNKKRRELERQAQELQREADEARDKQLRSQRNQAKQRAEKKAKREKLEQKREEKIKDRQADWLQRANVRINEIIEEHAVEEERVEKLQEARRQKKNAKQLVELQEKLEQQQKQVDVEGKREQAAAEREMAREVLELHTVDRIQREAQEEIETFLQHPAPVPLKQVLTGKVRPVPRVTELLAAYKDQREDLKELEDADIPARAVLRNQTLFQYVHDMQEKFESQRVKVPEPLKTTGASRSKSPRKGSPKGKGKPTSPNRSGAHFNKR